MPTDTVPDANCSNRTWYRTPVPIPKMFRERRSVRAFEAEKPPADVLARLVDALRWAPSAGHLESRHFYFVTDRTLRRKLARAAEQPFVGRAPVVVVACADLRIRREYGARGVQLYCLMDVAAAVQNLLLVAHREGLGACWVGALDEKEVRGLLGLPRHLRPVSLVPLGYPAEEPEAAERAAREDVATFLR